MNKPPKQYIITETRCMSGRSYSSRPLTVAEAVEYYQYSLMVGATWSHERGNKKINRKPNTIKSLLVNLTNASNNAARNGCGSTYKAKELVDIV
jgi:hypothetical protein